MTQTASARWGADERPGTGVSVGPWWSSSHHKSRRKPDMIPYRATLHVFKELALDHRAHLFDTSSAQLAEISRSHRSIAECVSDVISGSTIVQDRCCNSVSKAVLSSHAQWQADPERRAARPEHRKRRGSRFSLLSRNKSG